MQREDSSSSSEKGGGSHVRRSGAKRSAAFADLVSLASLQAVVDDTRASVDQIALSAAKVLEDPDNLVLIRRRVAEQEEWRRVVRNQAEEVKERCRKVSDDILAKTKQLEERRHQLQRARDLYRADADDHHQLESDLLAARASLSQTSAPTPALRASLARTLDFIFPISPLDPASLLFTIVDCPLPVPFPSTPTPPLSLPDQPSVTEDSVASALGFVAQVVQLLAAYEGVYLPYALTCAGSRSLVRDPISEMRGPRAFPLYSRGVELYRFEYAVYLLNKDIELLMMRRNLRALDLRHTLPNLKNLMLTVTSGDEPDPAHRKHHPLRSMDSLADLPGSSSSPSSPSVPSITLTSTASSITTITATSSASATPTPASSKRPFLSPLAAMLRSRYAGGGFLRPAPAERTSSGTTLSSVDVALVEDVLAVSEGVGAASPLPAPDAAPPLDEAGAAHIQIDVGLGLSTGESGSSEGTDSTAADEAVSPMESPDDDDEGDDPEDELPEDDEEEDAVTPTAATANGRDAFLEKRVNGHAVLDELSPRREIGVDDVTR